MGVIENCALAILPPSNDLNFRTADQPQNPPKCDLQSKSKSAEYIGFEIKITNQKRISNHDFKYFDLNFEILPIIVRASANLVHFVRQHLNQRKLHCRVSPKK